MNHEKNHLEEFVCSLEQLSDIIKDITKIEEEKQRQPRRSVTTP